MKKLIPLIIFIVFLLGCAPIYNISETKELMGTKVKITIVDKDLDKIEKALGDAFNEIKKVEEMMGIYLEDSPVSKLNKLGIIENPYSELKFVFEKAIHYSELSDGAFDITVQPILDLYTHTFKELKRPPTEEEIKEALELVDYKKIEINENQIKMQPGMKITLGGIAKGYAIDKAIESLKNNGIEHALVNAGGDMRAIGKKENNLPWQIALQNPRNKDEFITIIPLDNKAVATSGDYERYFTPDKKAHHIVNPKTGKSATELVSVTIITDTTIDADALATSVFVLGKEEGMELIEKLEGVEGLIISEEREIIKSKGFVW